MGQLEQSETNRDERRSDGLCGPSAGSLSTKRGLSVQSSSTTPAVTLKQLSSGVDIFAKVLSENIRQPRLRLYLSLSFLFSIRKLSQFYLNDSSVDKEVCSYYISKTTLSFV